MKHAYKKIIDIMHEYGKMDRHYQANAAELRSYIASRFRLTQKDVDIIMAELLKDRSIKKENRRKIRLP